MNGQISPIGDITPERVYAWSRPVLYGLLGLGIVAILASAYLSTIALAIIGAGLLAGLLFGTAARDELVVLCAILAGFISSAQYEAGFQLEEIVYGAVYLLYLAYWFISRLFVYQDRILRTKVDWALFLFLIYTTLSLALTPLLGGDMQVAISEWLAVTMLAFYFPIKEICIRRGDRIPQKPLLMSLGFVALYIAFRNFWYYKRGLAEAEFLWQIATGRVVMNEHVLLMASLVALTFLLHSRNKLPTAGLLGVFAVLAAGVVIGQSRAVWVSFLLGAAVIFFCVDRPKKLQILLLGVVGLAAIVGTGALLFDDFFTIIVAGLTDRFFSLQTAVVKDISLINRVIEIGAAWEHIRLNPIVGHGFGVPFKYYSLVYEWTHETSFIHNGPVGIWYRHGLIGLVLLSVFYLGSILTALRLVRGKALTRFEGTLAIAILAALAAESLVGNTENPFATSDKTLFIAALAGLAAASWHRARRADSDA